MSMTLTESLVIDSEVEMLEFLEDEVYIGMLAAMLHKLEIRALAELFLNADPARSTELSTELWHSTIPAHRQLVTDLWVASRAFYAPGKPDGEILRETLMAMDTDEIWQIRAQLPGGVFGVTRQEDEFRRQVRDMWKGLVAR